MLQIFRAAALFALVFIACRPVSASDPAPPGSLGVTIDNIDNSRPRLSWDPVPAAESYQVLSSIRAQGPFAYDVSGEIVGFDWTGLSVLPSQFFQLSVTSLQSNALLTATVLNRLAYGPTPDELERVLTGPGAIGPQAFIDEQLAPELIEDTLDDAVVVSANGADWVYVTATGTSGNSNPEIWIYMSGAGEGYVDEIKLVEGSVAEEGFNLVGNGDFEAPLAGSWEMGPNYVGSEINSAVRRSGNGGLKVLGSGPGGGQANSIRHVLQSSLPAGQIYTLSFWYLPSENWLTVRIPNANIQSSPDTTPAGFRLALEQQRGYIADLRTWYCQRAVASQRQLFEVMTQFWDNHFVTRSFKSFEYTDFWLDDNSYSWRMATSWEFEEMNGWREVLMSPGGTFHDALVVSAESPAMITYLDTARSRGDPPNIPNENYARELLELFTFGLDNGYDQSDIEEMSKVWTGWTVRVVETNDFGNPLAPPSMTLKPGATNSDPENLVGLWSFNFNPDVHYPDPISLFPGKTVPLRFGSPWAGRPYALTLPGRTGTNGIQDGYEVLRHLADQPFTPEYFSVKLCRLFVHDEFTHGYDFTDPNLSEEGLLVRDCMLAWENSVPKGQVREVLKTIFDSPLFRGHGSSMQKLKTPLEFVVSSVRSLRSLNADGSHTSVADAYSFAGVMKSMGGMELFDRLEPDGYPEEGRQWMSTGTLAERLRFVQSFCIPINQPGHVGAVNDASGSYCDPVGLMKKNLPSEQWTDGGAVVDYFLRILFPAEGRANLDLLKRSAVSYLNLADDGMAISPFDAASTAGFPSPYENRVRGMVAMLLSSPRFQEQ